MTRVSLKDIAGKLGISTATVSLVLNGKDKEGRVSKVMAEKIREEAKAMNYEPNNFAKGLRSGRSETIGLIVADISNPFFAQLAFHIQEHAETYGYSVIIANTSESNTKMGKMISILKSRQVDGFIIVPTEHGEQTVSTLVRNKFPVVLLDRYFPKIDATYVTANNYQASMEATSYLIDQKKCKRIALIIYNNYLPHMQDRRKGYLATMTRNGLYDPNLIKEVDHCTMTADVQKAIMELIRDDKKIDGIFFASNTISAVALKTLTVLNLDLSRDISAVCFDKSDALELSSAAVPFIQQPVPEMGRRAVDLLVGQITGEIALPVHEELQASLKYES